MKDMKNIGRIVLPIIILLLTVRINAVPVKAFDMIVRNLPNSEQLPTKELLCIFQDSEGYIVLKLNAEGESTIDIPAGCTVRIIKKIGKKPLVLREQGGYSFRLKD